MSGEERRDGGPVQVVPLAARRLAKGRVAEPGWCPLRGAGSWPGFGRENGSQGQAARWILCCKLRRCQGWPALRSGRGCG